MDELERALDYPWEKWTVFLHPAQRDLVEREFSGPARVSGSAGTGKTIVALHRAVFLARKRPHAKLLLATFSETLAKSLQTKLTRLVGNEPEIAERIHVHSITSAGRSLYEAAFGEPDIASEQMIQELLSYVSAEAESHKFSDQFLCTEWAEVVDAWQLTTWEEYRDVARLGRKTRIGEKQRKLLWSIFANVRDELQKQNLVTVPGMFRSVTESLTKGEEPPCCASAHSGLFARELATFSVRESEI